MQLMNQLEQIKNISKGTNNHERIKHRELTKKWSEKVLSVGRLIFSDIIITVIEFV